MFIIFLFVNSCLILIKTQIDVVVIENVFLKVILLLFYSIKRYRKTFYTLMGKQHQ